jgi:hypothetical protein
VQWSTRLGEALGAAAVGAGLATAALLVDPVGRVLVGAAALLLLALATRDLLLRPRLATGPTGVTVRALTGTIGIDWADLRVRVRITRRLGLRSRTLELEDTGDDAVLLVLGRHDLGADPAAVADALRAAGASAAR